jgi:hypothetical protein
MMDPGLRGVAVGEVASGAIHQGLARQGDPMRVVADTAMQACEEPSLALSGMDGWNLGLSLARCVASCRPRLGHGLCWWVGVRVRCFLARRVHLAARARGWRARGWWDECSASGHWWTGPIQAGDRMETGWTTRGSVVGSEHSILSSVGRTAALATKQDHEIYPPLPPPLFLPSIPLPHSPH